MQTLMGSIVAIGVWENKGAKGLNLKLLVKVCDGKMYLLVFFTMESGW